MPPSGPCPATSPRLTASRPTRRSWPHWSPTHGGAIALGQRALVNDEDPLGALETLRDVELRLEAVLAPLRTQEAAALKAHESAQRHIRDADAALAWARKSVRNRQGSALFDADKLLREAEQAIGEAREALDKDPLQARAAASRATVLTNRALATPGRQ